MADSLLDLAGVPSEGPPPNQSVLDAIAQMRAAFKPNYAGEAFGGGLNEWVQGAMQPGMSGYFNVAPNGNITPRALPVQQTAQQSGQSLGELAGSFFPSGELLSGGIGYNVRGDQDGQRGNDRGGFFTLQDLYGQRGGVEGIGVRGVPSIGTADQSALSTNNWRLLGRGPGWIMRNGRMIYTKAPETKFGGWIGAPMGFGVTAEHGMAPLKSVLGTGAWMGMPNTWTGASGWPGQDRPYTPDRFGAQQ